MAGAFPERDFGQLRSQHRLANIAEAKRSDYWGGVTWVYAATTTNGAGGGASDIIWEITPGEDNEFELMYGRINNGDTVARTSLVNFADDAGTSLGVIGLNVAAAADADSAFPAQGTAVNVLRGTGRLIVSGDMSLVATLFAVAASQDASLALALRVRGDPPTITATGNADASTAVATQKFF